jgi:hypothetical protein
LDIGSLFCFWKLNIPWIALPTRYWGSSALRVDIGFAFLASHVKNVYARCITALCIFGSADEIRFIEDLQIIHGFAFSAPGLPMVQQAHTQKRFARYSFPTLRTGNPVDNHLTPYTTSTWRYNNLWSFADRACLRAALESKSITWRGRRQRDGGRDEEVDWR